MLDRSDACPPEVNSGIRLILCKECAGEKESQESQAEYKGEIHDAMVFQRIALMDRKTMCRIVPSWPIWITRLNEPCETAII